MQDNRKIKDLCREPPHHVNIAYNSEPGFFELEEDGSVKKLDNEILTGEYDYIPKDTELMQAFLEYYHIIPNWLDCNFTWGWFDEEAGNWTGGVGKVKQPHTKLVW